MQIILLQNQVGSQGFLIGNRKLQPKFKTVNSIHRDQNIKRRHLRVFNQQTAEAVESAERIRLHNLSPFPNSRFKKTRVGRGYGAGKGGSAGVGQNGQKSRSGETIGNGFEGAQMPLYRRQPKLKGIAGGMKKGEKKHMIINLDKLSEKFPEGGEVDLQKLMAHRIIVATGSDRKLPLKILGTGEVSKPFQIKAGAVSEQAKQKIEQAGGSVEILQGRTPWTKDLGKKIKLEKRQTTKLSRVQKKKLKREEDQKAKAAQKE